MFLDRLQDSVVVNVLELGVVVFLVEKEHLVSVVDAFQLVEECLVPGDEEVVVLLHHSQFG